MGTRCNIKIETGDTTLWVYRHWDGYPAATGVDLARKLVNVKSAQEFINKLLNDDAYEVTTGQHGDIEYLYNISFTEYHTEVFKMEIRFETLERSGFSSDQDEDTFNHLDNYYRTQYDEDKNLSFKSNELLENTSKKEIIYWLGYYFRAALKMQIRSAEHQLKQDAYFQQLLDIEDVKESA